MYSYKNKKTSKNKRLPLFVFLLAFASLAVVGATYFAHQHDKKVTQVRPSGSVNLEPPTTSEKQATEEHKDTLAANQNQPKNNDGTPTPTSSTTGNSGIKNVTPIITHAEATEVDAFVPGVVEDGGVCTLTATKGSNTVTRTTSGLANVSTTNCGHFMLATGQLSSGDWNITVAYKSATASGTSNSQTLKV